MSERKRLLKIDEIVLDWELYPRMKVGWLTAYQYAQAMRARAVFPPITVGLYGDKLYMIDGWHRVEALKLLGESYVKAVVKPFESKREMFVEAVRLNTTHGRQLSVHEKVRIIHKLKDLKFSMEEITKVVRVPLDKIERFAARAVRGPNGKLIYMKSVVAKAQAATGADPSEVDQTRLSVRSVQQLLSQLIALLEGDMLPLETGAVKELTVRLHSLLTEKLQLTQTATSR